MAHLVATSMTEHSTAATNPAAEHFVVDVDSIPGQIGTSIIRASDGAIIRPPTVSPGAPTDGLTEHDVAILYRMLREVGDVIPAGEGLKRIDVSFQGVRYSVALVGDGAGDGFVFIVKRRQTE